MKKQFRPEQFIELGLTAEEAESLSKHLNTILVQAFPEDAWQRISKEILTKKVPYKIHHLIFSHIFPNWIQEPEYAPVWIPDAEYIKNTHIAQYMSKLKIHNYHEFHAWTANHFDKYWDYAIKKLNIVFRKPPQKMCDPCEGVESPRWLPDAKLNIAESCFNAPGDKTAVLFYKDNGSIEKLSYSELNKLSNRIANSLLKMGFAANDAIAINMPMTQFAVAIYLGIIKMGGIVVSIADSFSPEEIATRLRIANTKAIFTQDFILRGNKQIPLYEKVTAAHAPLAIVLPSQEKVSIALRQSDLAWEQFLVADENYQMSACDPMAHINILFSSGTTAEPKAIPWTQVTAIKAATDAYFHHNIVHEDILAWPTNLGWMMGPWLIFAALLNQATIALYEGISRDREFGKFVQDAKVTMLGVVPSVVASWRHTQAMEGFDWSAIKLFSSTGECSNPEDMLYLMYLAGYKPIIEYCGGTEIGGAYITSTLIERNYPSVFTTAALGLNFIIIDEAGEPTTNGEVALIPPSMGLSAELLNADHYRIYFANMPKSPDGKQLRRHGDQIRELSNGYYTVLGRADDTMNLNSIKVSSAEIERVLAGTENISETAAIAVSQNERGPSQLIIYAVTNQSDLDKNILKQALQEKINLHLNPLFKIYDIVLVTELPKTASNKIMRRVLRQQYNMNKGV